MEGRYLRSGGRMFVPFWRGCMVVSPHPDPGVGAPACTYPAVLVRSTPSSGAPESSQDPAWSPCTSPNTAPTQEENPGQRSDSKLEPPPPLSPSGVSAIMSLYRTCRSSWGASRDLIWPAVPHPSTVWGHRPIPTPLVPCKITAPLKLCWNPPKASVRSTCFLDDHFLQAGLEPTFPTGRDFPHPTVPAHCWSSAHSCC